MEVALSQRKVLADRVDVCLRDLAEATAALRDFDAMTADLEAYWREVLGDEYAPPVSRTARTCPSGA